MRGESNFRIEIFAKISRGQNEEHGTPGPQLVRLTARNIREYFYTKFTTKIRFSTPGLSALLPLAAWSNMPDLIF
jgi:hypothetical protein